MATTYKVLGQSNPSATTATTLYTCPASTQTVSQPSQFVIKRLHQEHTELLCVQMERHSLLNTM
jgi:hypothetical protein